MRVPLPPAMSSCHPRGGTGCLADLVKDIFDPFLLLLPAPSVPAPIPCGCRDHSKGGEALGKPQSNWEITAGLEEGRAIPLGGSVGLDQFNPAGRAVS